MSSVNQPTQTDGTWRRSLAILIITLLSISAVGVPPASASHSNIIRSNYPMGADLGCGGGLVRASAPIVTNAAPTQAVFWIPVVFVWNASQSQFEFAVFGNLRYTYADETGDAGPYWTMYSDPNESTRESSFYNLPRGKYYAVVDYIITGGSGGHWEYSYAWSSLGNYWCVNS